MEIEQLALPPRNRVRKASWKMLVALPCQALQVLSALNLPVSRMSSSGKEVFSCVGRGSPPARLICGRGDINDRE